MKTIAIIGVGPGLGLSIARQFGKQGFRVALIARTQTNLDTCVQQLQEQGIEAAGFRADIKDTAQLIAAFAHIKAVFGALDILAYSHGPGGIGAAEVTSVLDLTHDRIQEQLQLQVHGALTSVQAVLPDMLARGSGAIFFTTGVSSVTPNAHLADVGIAMAALRNYAHCLHDALVDKGIYVGHLAVGTWIAKGTEGDPDILAALIADMYEKRDRIEEVFLPR